MILNLMMLMRYEMEIFVDVLCLYVYIVEVEFFIFCLQMLREKRQNDKVGGHYGH